MCPSSTPTTPRLLSILASNPALQKVTLIGFAVPYDGGGKPSFRVQLRHLKELRLQGPSSEKARDRDTRCNMVERFTRASQRCTALHPRCHDTNMFWLATALYTSNVM